MQRKIEIGKIKIYARVEEKVLGSKLSKVNARIESSVTEQLKGRLQITKRRLEPARERVRGRANQLSVVG